MNITPLKYILFMENLISVFRNYTSFKRRGRKLIIIWILLEIVNLTFNMVTFAQYKLLYPITTVTIYMISVIGFSFGLLLSAIYQARRFHRLLSNFDNYYSVLQDSLYSTNLRRLQKTWSIVSALFFCIKMFVHFPIRITVDVKLSEKGLIIMMFNQIMCSVSDVRYVLEFCLLYCILYVISEQLDAISRSIDREIANMNVDMQSVEAEEVIAVYRDQDKCFDKWMQAYRNIKSSSDLCNKIFRVQLSIMLLMVTTYYIILLYSITRNSIAGLLTPVKIASNTFAMVVFLYALFLISKAGQKVQNSSAALRLKLCQLYVHALENQDFSKPVKDLLRFTSTRPIRISVFGSLAVNMSLVPSCVGFFTSYTVIALQMNNVL